MNVGEGLEQDVVEVLEEIKCPDDPIKVAILIGDGVYNTELTAPMDIFHHTKFRCETAMEVFTLSPSQRQLVSFEGLKVVADYVSTQDSLPHFDVLAIPAAEGHLGADLENDTLISLIQKLGAQAEYVISFCDGAFPLVESGLVDGLNVTTFPGDQDALEEKYSNVKVHRDYSFVRDGKFITSVGGAKSFDAAMYLVEEIFGKKAAIEVGEGMVIQWDLNQIEHVIF